MTTGMMGVEGVENGRLGGVTSLTKLSKQNCDNCVECNNAAAFSHSAQERTMGGGKQEEAGRRIKLKICLMFFVFSSAMRRQIGEQVLEVVELKRVVAKK